MAKEGGLCTAAVVKPDLTGVLLFPIDCSANFNTNYICIPKVSNTSNTTEVTQYELVLENYTGYHIVLKHNKTELQVSSMICPGGYNLFHASKCLKLVNYASLVGYYSDKWRCAKWKYNTNFDFDCKQ